MIIRKCHVENFGKLHQYDRTFSGGLNEIIAENGSGKSTLASFILVMFYGFANERTRDELKNERRRFAPWQNGVYGGSVSFSCQDGNYRIERTFGAKNGKTDTLQVYDEETNLPTDRFGGVPGEQIFLIDRESFERTVFVAQEDCGTSVTADISAKIGNVSSETADMGRYEEAQKKLKEISDRLTPDRKTGEIARLDAKIAELTSQTSSAAMYEASADATAAAIRKLHQQKDQLIRQQDEVSTEMTRRNARNDLKMVKIQADTLREGEKEASLAADRQRQYFPGRVPSQEETEEKLEEARQAGVQEQSASNFAFDEKDTAEYRRLSDVFSESEPDGEEIRSALEHAGDIRLAREKTSDIRLSPDERERLRREEEEFSGGVPDADTMESLIRLWQERNRLMNERDRNRSRVRDLKDLAKEQAEAGEARKKERQSEEMRRVRSRRAGLMLTVIGILLAAGSFLLNMLSGKTIFLVAAAAGLGLMLTGVVLRAHAGVRKEKAASGDDAAHRAGQGGTASGIIGHEEEYSRLLSDIRDEEEKISEADSHISAFLSQLNRTADEDRVLETLYGIRSDAEDYRVLRERDRACREASGKDRREEEESIAALIRKFVPEDDLTQPEQTLQKISYDLTKYQTLKSRLLRRREAERSGKEKKESVRSWLLSLGFEPGEDEEAQLMEIRDAARNLASLSAAQHVKQEALRRYEEEHREQLEKLKDGDLPGDSRTAEELNSRFKELKSGIESVNETIDSYVKQGERISAHLEEISRAEEQLETLQQRREVLQHRYDIVTRTRKLLEQARVTFSSRYMEPIKRAFDSYYEMMSPGDEKIYELDANLNISVREAGALRNVGAMSEGYKDMIGLCRRMAMVDAMYQEEKPFLVFDDPFVSLDDERLSGAMTFLGRLGGRYQIIYFTCQSNRISRAGKEETEHVSRD